MKTERSCGILCHITSLSGYYGIGTLGKEAYDFADLLQEAGQRYWQVLPVGPVGPVGPVTVDAAPVFPVGPVGPVTVEAAPVAPVGPVGPVGPMGPVGPA